MTSSDPLLSSVLNEALSERGRVAMAVFRDGQMETLSMASAVVASAAGRVQQVFQVRDPQQTVIARSTIKPIHAGFLYRVMTQSERQLPEVLPQEWAVMSSSHSGTREHQQWVQSVLDKSNLNADFLVCTGRGPHDETERCRLIAANLEPGPLHHMCSGHHTALGWLASRLAMPVADYWRPESPFQQWLCEELRRLAQPHHDVRILAYDDCHIPTVAVSMQTYAVMVARWATSPEYLPVVEGMVRYPELVGYADALDSLLMRLGRENLVAKSGAGGMMIVANRQRQEAMVLKEWGGNPGFRDALTIHALVSLGWLSDDATEALYRMPGFARAIPNTHVRQMFVPDLWKEVN